MMKLCRMCSKYSLSVLFFKFVFVILHSRPTWFCYAHLQHIIRVVIKKNIGNFGFNLIDNLATAMEEADVVV